VWYSSVLDAATQGPALVYGFSDDASNADFVANQPLWAQALKTIVGSAAANASKAIY
jgi:hypothetical protein